jgi:hypothetical protein
MFQVLIVIANDNFKIWVGFAYASVCLSSVSLAVCLITFWDQWNPIQSGLFFIILFAILAVNAISIQLGIRLRINSEFWIRTSGKRDRSRSKLESKFWKSCQPIEIWAGSFFTLSSMNYLLEVYGKVILESVISLLLAVRGSHSDLGLGWDPNILL